MKHSKVLELLEKVVSKSEVTRSVILYTILRENVFA